MTIKEMLKSGPVKPPECYDTLRTFIYWRHAGTEKNNLFLSGNGAASVDTFVVLANGRIQLGWYCFGDEVWYSGYWADENYFPFPHPVYMYADIFFPVALYERHRAPDGDRGGMIGLSNSLVNMDEERRKRKMWRSK